VRAATTARSGFSRVETLSNAPGSVAQTAAGEPWVQETCSPRTFKAHGILDLVVPDQVADTVEIYMGNGDGTIRPPETGTASLTCS
jgi:hypothetical protein